MRIRIRKRGRYNLSFEGSVKECAEITKTILTKAELRVLYETLKARHKTTRKTRKRKKTKRWQKSRPAS